MRRVLFFVLALLSVPACAFGQVCVGRPALAGNSKGNVGLGASFFDGGKGFGASGTFGGPLYGFVSFDYFDLDNTTLSLKSIGGGGGYEMPLGDGSVSVCPGASLRYGFGLEVLGIDVSALELAPGVAVGLSTPVSPTVSVNTFAQAAFVYTNVMFDAGPLGDRSEDDTAALLALGATLGFNGRVSIGPTVSIPIAEEDGDTVIGVFLHVAVGR